MAVPRGVVRARAMVPAGLDGRADGADPVHQLPCVVPVEHDERLGGAGLLQRGRHRDRGLRPLSRDRGGQVVRLVSGRRPLRAHAAQDPDARRHEPGDGRGPPRRAAHPALHAGRTGRRRESQSPAVRVSFADRRPAPERGVPVREPDRHAQRSGNAGRRGECRVRQDQRGRFHPHHGFTPVSRRRSGSATQPVHNGRGGDFHRLVRHRAVRQCALHAGQHALPEDPAQRRHAWNQYRTLPHHHVGGFGYRARTRLDQRDRHRGVQSCRPEAVRGLV